MGVEGGLAAEMGWSMCHVAIARERDAGKRGSAHLLPQGLLRGMLGDGLRYSSRSALLRAPRLPTAYRCSKKYERDGREMAMIGRNTAPDAQG